LSTLVLCTVADPTATLAEVLGSEPDAEHIFQCERSERDGLYLAFVSPPDVADDGSEGNFELAS
jgi:hypothetical protein